MTRIEAITATDDDDVMVDAWPFRHPVLGEGAEQAQRLGGRGQIGHGALRESM